MRFLTGLVLMLSLVTGVLCYGGQNIGAHLEQQDALEYSIISERGLQLFFDRLDAAMNAVVWSDDYDNAERRELMANVAFFRMLRDLSGLPSAGGAGSSSTAMDRGLIHNRMFLALDPQDPGLLNTFFAAENRLSPAEVIRDLPVGTVVFMSVDVRPEALLDALTRTGAFKDEFLGNIPENIPVADILRLTAGVWNLTILKSGSWQISVPDPENRLFALLKGLTEGAAEDAQQLELPVGLIVRRSDNRLLIYFDQEEVDEFAAITDKIQLTSLQEAALAKLPEKAVALAVWLDDKNDLVCGDLPLFTGEMPEVIALSRESDGLLLTHNGSAGLAILNLFTADLLVDRLEEISFVHMDDDDEDDDEAADEDEAEAEDEDDDEAEESGEAKITDGEEQDNGRRSGRNVMTSDEEDGGRQGKDGNGGVKRLGDDADDKNGGRRKGGKDERSKDEESDEEAPETPCQCEVALNAAKAALANSPDLTPGFYVLRDGALTAAGDSNDKIAYFGQIESEKPVPVFIMMPHDQRSFCVLFSDGTIQRMRLSKADSFRRIVGYIHTVKMYDEQVFQVLMECAAGFDRN